MFDYTLVGLVCRVTYQRVEDHFGHHLLVDMPA
jgi:hypothetical protein